LTFNGLHGVISQKLELFITTAVRTSNPAILYMPAKFEVLRGGPPGIIINGKTALLEP
jgi:hypothetical protein